MNQDQLVEINFMKWLMEVTNQEYDGNLHKFNMALNGLEG